MKDPKIPLYDLYQTAFLSLQGIQVDFERRGTRVVFLVPSNQETYELMATYNENPQIDLLDYVGSLRRMRAQMLSLREISFKREEGCHGNRR